MKFQTMSFENVVLLLNRDGYCKMPWSGQEISSLPVEYLMAIIDEDTIYILNMFICFIDKFI